MAEGFGRFWPKDHANLLRVAKASLMETHNSAGAGFKKGYFSRENTDRMQLLAVRSGKAATGLIIYLESLDPPTNRGSWRPRRRN